MLGAAGMGDRAWLAEALGTAPPQPATGDAAWLELAVIVRERNVLLGLRSTKHMLPAPRARAVIREACVPLVRGSAPAPPFLETTPREMGGC